LKREDYLKHSSTKAIPIYGRNGFLSCSCKATLLFMFSVQPFRKHLAECTNY